MNLVSSIYDINPRGTSFTPSATVTFKFSDSPYESDYKIYTYDDNLHVWVALANQAIDTQNNSIAASVSHLSLFGLFLKIDPKPPRTAQNIGLPGYENYVSSMTNFNFSAVDDLMETGDGKGCGVKDTVYKIDDGDWQVYADSFTISFESLHVVSYYSYDVIGNTEEVKSFSVIVDTTAPSTDLTTSRDLFVKDGVAYAKADDYFTLTSTDVLSGVKETKYKIGEELFTLYASPFTIQDEGNYTIEYYSSDNVENKEAVKTYTVVIDTVSPKFTNRTFVDETISLGKILSCSITS